MKNFCIFIPLYNKLKKEEYEYLLSLVSEVENKYKETIDIIFSDNSKEGIHKSFKSLNTLFIENKSAKKNRSIFNSLDLIEKYKYLIILDPDDKLILENISNIYDGLKKDIIQLPWIEKGKGRKFIFSERLANYCTINKTSILRKAFNETDIWDVTAADDYAMNFAILYVGGTFEKKWFSNPVYIYERNNIDSVSNKMVFEKFDEYYTDTIRVLDFQIKNISFRFKPRYLFHIKIKGKYKNSTYSKYFNKKLFLTKYYFWFKLINFFKWNWRK